MENFATEQVLRLRELEAIKYHKNLVDKYVWATHSESAKVYKNQSRLNAEYEKIKKQFEEVDYEYAKQLSQQPAPHMNWIVFGIMWFIMMMCAFFVKQKRSVDINEWCITARLVIFLMWT